MNTLTELIKKDLFAEGIDNPLDRLDYVLTVLSQDELLTRALSTGDRAEQKQCNQWLTKVSSLAKDKKWEVVWAGLCLWRQSISSCTQQQLSEHLEPWIKQLTDMLKRGRADITSGMKCLLALTTAELIERGCHFAETKRAMLNLHVPRLVPMIVKVVEKSILTSRSEALEALRLSSRCHPNAFKSLLPKIEDLLFNQILTESEETRTESIITLAELASTNESSWTRTANRAIRGSHYLLGIIYTGVDDQPYQDISDDQHLSSLLSVRNDANVLASQYSSLLKLSSVLLEKGADEKREELQVQVPIHDYVRLIKRGLTPEHDHVTVSQKIDTDLDDVDRTMVIFALSMLSDTEKLFSHVHTCSYRLLSSLLLSVRTALSPFLSDITSLLLAGLEDTQTSPSLREEVYKCSSYFVSFFGIHGASSVSTAVLSSLYGQLSSFLASRRDSNTIVMQVGHNSKELHSIASIVKRQKKTSEEQLGSKNVQKVRTMNQSEEKNILAALTAFMNIIQYSGTVLPYTIRCELDTLLCSILLDPSILLALMKCLLTSILSPVANQPSVLSYALAIFSKGRNDPSQQISLFCAAAVSTCELSIHPRAPPLIVNKLTVPFHLETSPLSALKPTSTHLQSYAPMEVTSIEDQEEEKSEEDKEERRVEATPTSVLPYTVTSRREKKVEEKEEKEEKREEETNAKKRRIGTPEGPSKKRGKAGESPQSIEKKEGKREKTATPQKASTQKTTTPQKATPQKTATPQKASTATPQKASTATPQKTGENNKVEAAKGEEADLVDEGPDSDDE
ncbi:hypothetical protein PROFUN_03237 [Planoprotostelium fungivorum]|uniref:Pre-rRNA-processing protein RIX1 N-terminal domain-containing protein n=1 Tax=Planoprotostelium fungivorum TaxID=1890364 RepID=A0A2P6NX32_9EUKA|nr:hypothetical protein PROFUN_03228 [Planoprotostelium fungivorum]PRP88520.1 hypothetical protein PROFUN_03237 [Planoprotostelium fungivorum]